jgi:transposase-like protein
MSERKYRRFTAEEKLAILKEAEQPGVTIAEVCRKHRLAASMFYSWRAVALQAVGSAMKNTDRRGQVKPDAETERLRTELDRMRAVVAEITAENLELKKKI